MPAALAELRELAANHAWPSVLDATRAILANSATDTGARRAAHILRLKAMMIAPLPPDEREASIVRAAADFPQNPAIALMSARLLRRTACGSRVLRLARSAMASPGHFTAAAGVVVDVLLERGRLKMALRLAGQGDTLDRLPVGIVSRLAGAAIVAGHIDTAADLIANAEARDRYASGVQRYAMIIRNTLRERGEADAGQPRHVAVLCANGDDGLRFGAAVAPRLGLTFVGDTAQLTNENAPWVCARCGPGCPCLDDDFRFEMQQDNRRWFARIAEQLGATAILSCEKSVLHYLNHDPLRRFETVILYSSPDSVIDATVARLKALPLAEGGLAAAVGKAIDAWSHANTTYLELAASTGSTIVVDLAAFERDPEAHLPRLAERLGCELRSAEASRPAEHFAAAASASLAPISAGDAGECGVQPDDVTGEATGNHHTAFLHQLLERRYRQAFAAS